MSSKLNLPVLTFFLFLAFTKILSSWLLPITQDEAYYFYWSKSLDFGYFDHPPIVAWLAYFSRFDQPSVLLGRLGSIVVTMVTFSICLRLFKKVGFTNPSALITALLIFYFNFGGLLFGVITTPDVFLVCTWTLVLHELITAFTTPWRWITVGVAVGLGLLGKYIMILSGIIILVMLFKHRRSDLKTVWPYAGIVACILTFLPNLWWNANHDWVTIKFQTARGLQGSHQSLTDMASDLPKPQPYLATSQEAKLGQYFSVSEKPKKIKPPRHILIAAFERFLQYAVSQIALWGFFITLFVHYLWQRFIKTPRIPIQKNSKLTPPIKTVLWLATLVPLIFFGIISFFTKVEANWSAVYLVSGSILFANFFSSRQKLIYIAAGLNLLVIFLSVVHTRQPFLSTPPAKDRMLLETHGYKDLADMTTKLEEPLLADSYQIVSMIKFYNPDIRIAQWPDITRRSELTRRPEFSYYTYDDLLRASYFWLITTNRIPPRLNGFQAQELSEIRDCANDMLKVHKAFTEAVYVPPCPRSTVHIWYLAKYRNNRSLSTLK